MPITVWNPPAKSVRPPSPRAEELKRRDSETGGDGDSLLLNAELAAGAVSSILKDSDLKRSSVLPVDEALALSDRTRPGYPSKVSRVVPPSGVPLYNP